MTVMIYKGHYQTLSIQVEQVSKCRGEKHLFGSPKNKNFQVFEFYCINKTERLI